MQFDIEAHFEKERKTSNSIFRYTANDSNEPDVLCAILHSQRDCNFPIKLHWVLSQKFLDMKQFMRDIYLCLQNFLQNFCLTAWKNLRSQKHVDTQFLTFVRMARSELCSGKINSLLLATMTRLLPSLNASTSYLNHRQCRNIVRLCHTIKPLMFGKLSSSYNQPLSLYTILSISCEIEL